MTYAKSDDPSGSPDPVPAPDEAIRRLQARLERERTARREAESLLEAKSLALFQANHALSQTALELESRVAARTAELNAAVREARLANEAKGRFLALMSHEIRTPLNGVLGLSELLASTRLDASQTTYVKNILTAGNALLVVINDILDFSKIEAGEMALERIAFDPVKVVTEALDLVRVQVQDRPVTLELRAEQPLPSQMVGDPTRVRQVLLNLVGNAVKFTREGSVTVSLQATQDTLTCAVQDCGIGMSAATVAGLFEPFRQADNSIARKFGGTGLGLVICKSLIEKMDGQLRVRSVEGQGTCFSFDLPWVPPSAEHLSGQDLPAAQHSPSELATTAAETDISQLRILLVDDQPINRLMARSQLKQLGCLNVDEAHNGLQALDALRLKPYDVVLMDLQMPEMDGLEATRTLRSWTTFAQPVVIAMTANAFSEDREASVQAGMDHFLTKPVKLDTLRAALHTVGTAMHQESA